MKKKICFILIIILLLTTSVPVMAFNKDDVQSVLTDIKEKVEQTNDILDTAIGVIKWQISVSKQSIEDYQKAAAKGEEYINPVSEDEIKSKVDELKACVKQVQKIKTDIEDLSYTQSKPVDRTIDAAKVYISWIDAALNDVTNMISFDDANEAAMKPLEEFDDQAPQDELAFLEGLYTVIVDVTEDMEAIKCPDYMQTVYSSYIGQLQFICTILESTYNAIQRKDVLQSYSVTQLIGRTQIQIMNHEIMLVEQFNLQFEKALMRLEGKVQTLNHELLSNCDVLLKAIGGR